eukprot:6214872-Amphidinium_carterae.1
MTPGASPASVLKTWSNAVLTSTSCYVLTHVAHEYPIMIYGQTHSLLRWRRVSKSCVATALYRLALVRDEVVSTSIFLWFPPFPTLRQERARHPNRG